MCTRKILKKGTAVMISVCMLVGTMPVYAAENRVSMSGSMDMAISTVASQRADKSKNEISGLSSSTSYAPGSGHAFTVTGATTSAADGNDRYIPYKYTINGSSGTLQEATSSASTSLTKMLNMPSSAGTYTLEITFMRQVYNGSTGEWENTDTYDTKAQTFHVSSPSSSSSSSTTTKWDVSFSFTLSNKVSKQKKTFTVTTSTVKGAKGFDVQYSLKNLNKTTKGASVKDIGGGKKANRKVIKTKKSKATYYVRVRAYKVVDGERIYSNWSTVRKIKSR